MDLCFYLGVEVEKEKDIKAKIRTFERNEIIASLIEASILCEIAQVYIHNLNWLKISFSDLEGATVDLEGCMAPPLKVHAGLDHLGHPSYLLSPAEYKPRVG